MRQGPQLASRAASAKNLLARGEVATVVPAMISEWNNGAEDLRTLNSQMTWGEGEMIEVLATCGSVDPISVLSRDFESLSIERRKSIVSGLNIGEKLFAVFSFFPDEGLDLVGKTPNPSPECLAAIEQLLVQAIANIVSDVQYSTRSVKPNESFQQRVDRLKGTQLTSSGLVKLILDTLEDLPNGAFGIKLAANRYGDHTGVVINVTFVDTAEFQGGTIGWSRSHRVRLDDKSLSSGFGTSTLSYGQTANAYKDLVDAADKALAAPPHLSFEIRASVIREK